MGVWNSDTLIFYCELYAFWWVFILPHNTKLLNKKMNCLLKCMCNRITGVTYRSVCMSDTPITGNWINEHARYSYMSVWNSDSHIARNRALYSIASYMSVWNSDTLIFHCELYGLPNFGHPYILSFLLRLYGCLNFRHSYILFRVIWGSEIQTRV
jgi:hypothetical protein